jgi:hypothetical protein
MGKRRIDERDIMFSRFLLDPGSERFAAYYRRHPENGWPTTDFAGCRGC